MIEIEPLEIFRFEENGIRMVKMTEKHFDELISELVITAQSIVAKDCRVESKTAVGHLVSERTPSDWDGNG